MHGQSREQHDSYSVALSGIHHVDLWAVADDGNLYPYVRIEMAAVVERLLVLDNRLRYDIDRVSAEIMHWGRLAAMAQRAWTHREREYRMWRAQVEMDLRQQHVKAKLKPPSGDLIEATYRTAPAYGAVTLNVERAQETSAVVEAIYKAFKQKADVLTADVRRAPDGSLQRLSP